jgi:CRP/FNR family transcriptional regulator, cyclic AMP receptor protein
MERTLTVMPDAKKERSLAAGPHDAVYLGEGNPGVLQPIDRTGMILAPLSQKDRDIVMERAVLRQLPAETPVLTQGKRYGDIYIIETGRVRTYYVSPSGREFTLAYWTPGHFIGVPELFGTGENLWAAATMVPSTLAILTSEDVRWLLLHVPVFAMSLVEGLNYKGRILSSALQMLGTRSITSRLAQLLLTLAARHGRDGPRGVRIEQRYTHEELANMIGSTRQWVTTTLAHFTKDGLVEGDSQCLTLSDADRLRKLVR